LCYIGGEIALVRTNLFESAQVTFPMLLRNSVVLATEKQAKKTDKLTWNDLFFQNKVV
jgi:hypothetical protein